MIVFKLVYNRIDEEVKLQKTDIYKGMDKVIKLDSIRDAISELEAEYEKVFKEDESR